MATLSREGFCALLSANLGEGRSIEAMSTMRHEYADSEQFCAGDGQATSKPGDTLDPLIGEVLADRYKVLRVIGEGHGAGHLAKNIHAELDVAIKILAQTPAWIQKLFADLKRSGESSLS